MANIVFDSSVILALLHAERVDLDDLPGLSWVSMSSVNVAEVWTQLEDKDDAARRADAQMLSFLRAIEPFTEAQARSAGELRRLGKHISLGDRACLALALDLGAEVFTADRARGQVCGPPDPLRPILRRKCDRPCNFVQ